LWATHPITFAEFSGEKYWCDLFFTKIEPEMKVVRSTVIVILTIQFSASVMNLLSISYSLLHLVWNSLGKLKGKFTGVYLFISLATEVDTLRILY
jgi:hypothetical protein